MSSVEWKDFVPSYIIPQIQCGCFNHFSNDSVTTIVCTNKQQILEISQFSVIHSCNIPFQDSKRVSIFYSYDPDYEHYLVEADKSLFVIRKTETLEVYKQYQNVDKLEVKDGFNCGFPQVHICLLDEFEPIITDFTDRDFSDFYDTKEYVKAQSEFAFSLSCNLQDIRLKFEKNKQRLRERRNLRTKALYNFTENVVNTQGDFVSKFTSKRPANDAAGIVIGGTWQKLHHDKWIIGVDFKTTSNEVTELELLLDAEEYSSHLLRLNRDTTGGGFCWISDTSDPRPNHFQRVSNLPPNSFAHFLAVQSKPCFLDSSCTTRAGVISYQVNERKFQAVISNVTLKPEHLLNDQLLPFTKDLEKVQNLLAILVSCEFVDLKISLPYSLEVPVEEILTQKLDFKLLPKFGYYFNSCPTNVGLCGMLVYLKLISATTVYVSLYGRDYNQLILFLNCVNNYLPNGTSFSKYSPVPNTSTVEDGMESVKSELKLIASTMEKHVVGENIQVPMSVWKLLRNNLHVQECNTDSILIELLNHTKID